jgi:hypothetical protein
MKLYKNTNEKMKNVFSFGFQIVEIWIEFFLKKIEHRWLTTYRTLSSFGDVFDFQIIDENYFWVCNFSNKYTKVKFLHFSFIFFQIYEKKVVIFTIYLWGFLQLWGLSIHCFHFCCNVPIDSKMKRMNFVFVFDLFWNRHFEIIWVSTNYFLPDLSLSTPSETFCLKFESKYENEWLSEWTRTNVCVYISFVDCCMRMFLSTFVMHNEMMNRRQTNCRNTEIDIWNDTSIFLTCIWCH